MSPTSLWIVASAAIVPALGITVLAAAQGSLSPRFAALQAATTLSVLLVAMLTFAIDQASSIDLALGLALLSLPGSLVVAVFVERWL